MLTVNQNIEELRKILKEQEKKNEEANEFLDAIETNAIDLNLKVAELEEVNKDEDDDEEDDYDAACDSSIDCGIGFINYEEPDNILLQQLMENLTEAIKKTNPLKVSELLASI